jgi:hypothetical protein
MQPDVAEIKKDVAQRELAERLDPNEPVIHADETRYLGRVVRAIDDAEEEVPNLVRLGAQERGRLRRAYLRSIARIRHREDTLTTDAALIGRERLDLWPELRDRLDQDLLALAETLAAAPLRPDE